MDRAPENWDLGFASAMEFTTMKLGKLIKNMPKICTKNFLLNLP